tara:strand:+ start:179 stop:550 length:372 start_codon:yes stop_codon:yes gene_type:complete
MKIVILAAALLFSFSAAAHEMTPAYLKIKQSEVTDVYATEIKMYNRRSDVDYYQISVFDGQWNRLPFASFQRLFKLPYTKRKTIKVYFQKEVANKVVYVCTKSKLYKGAGTFVSSRICSKVKR